MRLDLGQPVRCSDGPFGELADVVIDPTSRRVTHLVAQPDHRHQLARLVPVELVTGVGDGERPEISLAATVADVRRLAPVQEFWYLRLDDFPVQDPDWDVGVRDVLASPYYDALRLGSGYEDHIALTYDRIPKSEVEIRRGSQVISANGDHVGNVDGFLVDGDDQITHLVLERGHLWGRREVTIPIGAVAKVETDAVTLTLSKDDVGRLDSIPLRRWRS